jgi:hypothetical protein
MGCYFFLVGFVIAQFVVKVKDGWEKGKLEKLRLSHHCHFNGIALSV